MANTVNNFELAMKSKAENLMIDRMDQNHQIVNRYLNDPTFQSIAFNAIVKRVYEEIQPRANVEGLRLTASWWATGGRSDLPAG